MPYIGKNPVGGGFHKLDNLTASATDTYALTLGSAAYYPESANQLLVSLNGVIQAPQDSFTVSGSNLVFDTALTASDSIDFVVALGDVLAVKTVTDGAITTAKLGNSAVTSAKLDTNIAVSGNLDVGTIRDAAGTNTAMTIDSTGRIVTPARPAFHHKALGSSSMTGDLVFNTEIFDVGNVFDNTVFTAPVTGLYQFSAIIFATNSSGGTVSGGVGVNLQKSTDGGSSYSTYLKTYNNVGSGGYVILNFTSIVQLNSNDKIKLNTSDYIYVDNNGIYTHFMGYLIG